MIYIIEHSTNGTVKTTEDQFITAKFNTVKEARCFVKHIILIIFSLSFFTFAEDDKSTLNVGTDENFKVSL